MEQNKRQIIYDSPVGRLCIEEDCLGICRINRLPFLKGELSAKQTEGDNTASPLLCEAIAQLNQYFSGERKDFNLPLSLNGTEFQKKVWNALQKIPYGETDTYGGIAAKIGSPKASRAVGMSNNKNPIMIIVPCHRVIGANGSLTGYAGGLEMKKYLLDLEKASLK